MVRILITQTALALWGSGFKVGAGLAAFVRHKGHNKNTKFSIDCNSAKNAVAHKRPPPSPPQGVLEPQQFLKCIYIYNKIGLATFVDLNSNEHL